MASRVNGVREAPVLIPRVRPRLIPQAAIPRIAG